MMKNELKSYLQKALSLKEEETKAKVEKLKKEIERGVKRNGVFPLDWCFNSIDEIFKETSEEK